MAIIKAKVRGFVCVTAHPIGCAKNIEDQVNYIKTHPKVADGPKRVLIIGASAGYGLASRITAAFGSQAATVGIFFERPPTTDKPASGGWYNSVAFEKFAHDAGLYAKSINGDAFSNEIKAQTIDLLKKEVGPVDLVIYSLASPRRTDPNTGETYKSTLKPIGQKFVGKTLDTDKKIVTEVTLEPASEEEIESTIKVMGGEDWEMWIHALNDANLLAPGVKTLAYSYIGPKVTWPIYKNGTIGKAKEDLEKSADRIDNFLKKINGSAHVSINKALVTQASSAIPVVPLYNSLLFKIMKANGTHEGCIEQMYRMFAQQLYNGHKPKLDEGRRIRLDDLEMTNEVQDKIEALWPKITTENLDQYCDFAGYQEDFLKLFGFSVEGVDYDADVDLEANFSYPISS